LKVEERIIYATLKDRTTLLSNDAGFIGNIIGTALYWNPTSPIYNTEEITVSNTFLNPVELLDSYKFH
jgi:iron complex outermembrane receptor protein